MTHRNCSFSLSWFVIGLVLGTFGTLVAARPAMAIKNRTIVMRATGSGALLGLGAGLVSYPFAKSKNTIFAGAAVGAILGAVYGYYMVGARDDRYREQQSREEYSRDAIGADEWIARNEEREAILRFAPRPVNSRLNSRPSIPLEISVVVFSFR